MARPNYGPGEHCAFDDFPQKITVVVDELLASNSGLFDLGQSVVLQQTPLSGQEQGDKVVGSELPEKRMIYTDTGEDDSFSLKVSYYGWGKFFLENAGDETFKCQMTAGMTLQAGDQGEETVFEAYYPIFTQIPSTQDMLQKFGVEIARSESDYEVPDIVSIYEPPDNDNDNDGGGGGSTDTSDSGGGGGAVCQANTQVIETETSCTVIQTNSDCSTTTTSC